MGDAVSNRLQTISDHPSEDASGQARLRELVLIFNNLDKLFDRIRKLGTRRERMGIQYALAA